MQSRPMRARGLKLRRCLHSLEVERVAPHAGAWIETENRAGAGGEE